MCILQNIMYMYYFDTNKNNLKIKRCPCSQVDHNFDYISEISHLKISLI